MTRFVNRTRRSRSIPRRLVREGRLYLLPLYYLLRMSDLGREGIDNSGSANFADHIYRGRPHGRFVVGTVLDAILLHLPSARAFRWRYRYSRIEIERLIHERPGCERVDVLAIPCGHARELFDVAEAGRASTSVSRRPVTLHGIDLDDGLIRALQVRSRGASLPLEFSTGDALDAATYRRRYDAIVSLGFTEFLDDGAVLDFYRLVRKALNPRGRLITSGLKRHALSDYALRHVAELHAHYRTEPQLRALASRAGFERIRTYHDGTGLLTMLVAQED